MTQNTEHKTVANHSDLLKIAEDAFATLLAECDGWLPEVGKAHLTACKVTMHPVHQKVHGKPANDKTSHLVDQICKKLGEHIVAIKNHIALTSYMEQHFDAFTNAIVAWAEACVADCNGTETDKTE